jgi:hypothetical protein
MPDPPPELAAIHFAYFPLDQPALIMASATPASSEGSTSISARAERGVRGFQHDAELLQVADAVIEADQPCTKSPVRNMMHWLIRALWSIFTRSSRSKRSI